MKSSFARSGVGTRKGSEMVSDPATPEQKRNCVPTPERGNEDYGDSWREGNGCGESATGLNRDNWASVVKMPRELSVASRVAVVRARRRSPRSERRSGGVGKRPASEAADWGDGILFDQPAFLTQTSLRAPLFFLLLNERTKPLAVVGIEPRTFWPPAKSTRESAPVITPRKLL